MSVKLLSCLWRHRRKSRYKSVAAIISLACATFIFTNILAMMREFIYADVSRHSQTDAKDGQNVGTTLALTNSSRERQGLGYRLSSSTREKCKMYSNMLRASLDLKSFDSLIFEKKKNVIFCSIPKAGCTSWLYILGNDSQPLKSSLTNSSSSYLDHIAHQSVHRLKKRGLHKLSMYPESQRREMLNKAFTFLVVRHPLERLASAFRDKFEMIQAGNPDKVATDLYDTQTRLIARKLDIVIRHDLTFKQFIMYLVKTEPADYNQHWRRYVDLCHPCEIQYDYIASTESMRTDSEEIFRRIGLNNVVLPHLHQYSKGESYIDYYKTIPSILIKQIYNIYYLDFVLFGYNAPIEILSSDV